MERARAENQRLGIMLLTTLLLMLSYTTVSQSTPIKTYAVVIEADGAVDSYATSIHADLTNGHRKIRDIMGTFQTQIVPVGNGTKTTKRPLLTTRQPTTVKADPWILGNETNPTENSTIHSSNETHSIDGTKTTPPLTENSTAKRTTSGPITSTATPTPQITTSPPLHTTPLPSGHNDNNSSTGSPTTAAPTDLTNKRTSTNDVIEVVTDPSTTNVTPPIEFSTVHNTSSPIVTPSTPPTNSTGPITSTTTTTTQNSTSPPLRTTTLPSGHYDNNSSTEIPTTMAPIETPQPSTVPPLPTTPQPSDANLTEFTTTKPPESGNTGALVAAVVAVLLLICCVCFVIVKCQTRQRNPTNHEMGIRKPLIVNTNATGIRNKQYHITEEAICVRVC